MFAIKIQNDSFGCNTRSELTSATLGNAAYAYAFDHIGNRATASEAGTQLAYAANALNQYATITETEAFTPTYDADGNATLIKTTTGTWSVSCNGENRPVRFENAGTQTVVECGYDSLGRRFEKKVSVAGTLVLHERYAYRGFLQIAAFDVAGTQEPALKRVIYWDPTEETATRPLAISIVGDNVYFPTVDLTKNVCELVDFYGNVAATYDYAPFGNVSAGTPSGTAVPANPLQWSSEICDSELNLVYYNYRHYSPALGRFLARDPIEEQGGLNLYCFCGNNLLNLYDLLGYVGIKIEPYQNTNIVKVSPYSSKLNGREAYIQVTLTPFQVGIKLKKRKIFGDDIFALDVRGGGFSSVTYHSENILFEHPNNIFRKKSKLYMHEEQHYLDRKKIYEEYQKIILSYNEVEICGDYCQDQYISVNDIAIRLMKAKIGLADNLYHSIPGNYYDSENDQKEISQNINFFSNEVKVLEKQLINAQKALEKCIKEHQK